MSNIPIQPVIPFTPSELAWLVAFLGQFPGTLHSSDSIKNTPCTQVSPPILLPGVPGVTLFHMLSRAQSLLFSAATTMIPPPPVPSLKEYIRMQSQEAGAYVDKTGPLYIAEPDAAESSDESDQIQPQKIDPCVEETKSTGAVSTLEGGGSDPIQPQDIETSVASTEAELDPVSEDDEFDDRTPFKVAQIPLPPSIKPVQCEKIQTSVPASGTENGDTRARIAHRTSSSTYLSFHNYPRPPPKPADVVFPF